MQTNKSLDGHSRKRIYLFRHGEVNYMPSGKVVEDPNQVDLTEKGLLQAKLIDENTKKISFERIISSGLPRTIQTGAHMAKRRNLIIEAYPELREYQWDPKSFKDNDVKKFGYLFESSKSKDAIGGIEEADEFYNRVTIQLEKIIKEDWSQIAIVLHGAVNAAIMCWLNDIDISLASKFDQDHAALNIIDIDTKEDGEILRKSIRRYNIPPDLSDIDSDIRSSWESTASKIISFNESAN